MSFEIIEGHAESRPEIRRIVIAARLPALEREIAALEEEVRIRKQILSNLRCQENDYIIEEAAIDRNWGREPRTM